jgi:hypothetical protein
MGLTQYDERYPIWASVTITPTEGTDPVILAEFPGSASRLDTILIRNSQPSDVIVEVGLGDDNYPGIGRFTVPALAGADGIVPTYDLLGAMRAVGLAEIILAPGVRLYVTPIVAMTEGYALDLIGIGGYV